MSEGPTPTKVKKINPIPVSARGLQGLRAGVVSRVLAGGIDYAIIFGATVGLYLGVVVLRFLIDPRNFTPPEVPVGWFVIAGFGFLIVYLWIFFATTGRTIGARLLGLRVVGRKGTRLQWWSAFVRACFCAVFPIGLFWCAVSRENRSVQDVVLRTSVIHDWPVPHAVPVLSDIDERSAL